MYYLIAFIGTIPAANWLIHHWGVTCIPNGPCLIPVWPGIMAPSGVLVIGLALVLRDAVQRTLGRSWAIAAIVAGAALSFLFASPALAMASGVAFLVSELADFAVYTPLQRRRLITAVLASSLVGAVVDSAVFLHLAFGSLEYLTGQIIGKMWAAVVAVPIILAFRRFHDPSATGCGPPRSP